MLVRFQANEFVYFVHACVCCAVIGQFSVSVSSFRESLYASVRLDEIE